MSLVDGMPSWFIGANIFWLCMAVGVGVRYYRTRQKDNHQHRGEDTQD